MWLIETAGRVMAIVGLALLPLPVLAAGGQSPSGNPQCPVLPTFIARLTTKIPDLGGGRMTDETNSPVEPIGSRECPAASPSQCDQLAYLSFMFALLDLSPQAYRRPGLASYMANITAEDSSVGGQCSAERIGYSGDNIRKQFKSLGTVFCSSSGLFYETGQRAGVVVAEGVCDTSDIALTKLKTQIVAENPSLANRDGYQVGFAPIVVRMYRVNTGGVSDEDGFLYRGRGFLQMTGKPNYQSCQTDVEAAARWLGENPNSNKVISGLTRLNWTRLDVVKTPEAVSANQYLASFCAASYWKSQVAQQELTWAPTDSHFNRIVKAINKDASKVGERKPRFTYWCGVVGCAKNYPSQLDYEKGFGALIRLSQQGAVPK